MWENETVVLLTSLKKRIIGDRKRINLADIIKEKDLPDFIQEVISRRIDYLLLQETPLSVKATPHFDLKKVDLSKIRDLSIGIIRSAAILTKEEIETIIQEALNIRLDYLVKPRTIMQQFIFQNETSVSLERLTEILVPFTKINSYPKNLLDSCKAENVNRLDAERYEKIIRPLLTRDESEAAISYLLKDFSLLTKYLSEAKGEEVTSLEGSIVQEFLTDRFMTGFRRAMDIELKLGRTDFTSTDVELILKRYLELRAEFVSQDNQNIGEVPEPASRVIQEEEITAPVKDDILNLGDVWGDEADEVQESEEPTETVELESEPVAAVLPDLEMEKEMLAEITENKSPDEDNEAEEKPMRIIRREKEETAPAKSEKDEAQSNKDYDDLRDLLDAKTEKVFIKKLFGGDKEAYAALFEKLNESESWRVAKILIDNELFKRDVDPFSREAIKLVDLVYSRYYPEENTGG